jgi:hypothetical protein
MIPVLQSANGLWRGGHPNFAFLLDRGRLYFVVILCGVLLSLLSAFVSNAADVKISISTVVALLALSYLFLVLTSRNTQQDDVLIITDTDRAVVGSLLKETIAGYAARQPNWDGMDGIAPRPDAIADALAFIDGLPIRCPMPDEVFAPGDGEVMFQWRRSRIFIEVGFFGDDMISWFARIADRQPLHGDEAFDKKTGRKIPTDLTNALKAVA